ncbi:MAG: ABC transporter permease [Planctomycetota bacterium]|nr:ABC transporter permease [Planctomycetota bacterium]
MTRLIFWRLLQLPVILAVIFVVTFTLAWIIPGNPLEKPDGQRPDAEISAAILRQYNLDNPWRFAGEYLKGVFTRGDFGPSLRYLDQRVSDIIGQALPVSAAIGTLALAIGLMLGLAAGILGALWPRSPLDLGSLAVAMVGVSLPTFVTGSILLALAAGLFGWAPIGGWTWPGWSVGSQLWWSRAGIMMSHLILPALTLGLAPAAYIARLIRLGLADVMSSDFIRTARAKGLSERQSLFRHALKVAFLPVLSFLGPAAAVTLTGSFVVEQVFAVPGLGEHFVNAVRNKDQFLILGVVLVYSTILIVFNLVVDVAYAWIDPRIEMG